MTEKSLSEQWHAMPEVRDRALRHAAERRYDPMHDRFYYVMPPPYFWLGAEAEGLRD